MSPGKKSFLFFFAHFRNKERIGDASNGSFQAKALTVQPQKEISYFVRSPGAVGHSKGGTKCYGATSLCILLFAPDYLAGHASETTHTAQGKKGGSRGNRHSRLTSPRVAAACACSATPAASPRETKEEGGGAHRLHPSRFPQDPATLATAGSAPAPPRTFVTQRGTHGDLDSRRVS